MKQKKKRICIVALLVCVFLAGCKGKSYMQRQEIPEEEPEEIQEQEAEKDWCFVQVEGAVHKPGVYKLAQGSRVYQAIEKAGGLKEGASVKELNQARVLTDGEMIYVNTIEEMQLSQDQSDGKVNINQASAEELTTLAGIGETRAQAIILYRESNGLFSSPEEIKNVSGIGESTYLKIADKIKVN